MLKPIVPAEADVQAEILKWLRCDPRVAWAGRYNSGVAWLVYNGKKRPFRANDQDGHSDILGMLKGGRLIAVEVKRPGWKKPTDDREHKQAEFLLKVREGGGIAGFATGIECVKKLLEGI